MDKLNGYKNPTPSLTKEDLATREGDFRHLFETTTDGILIIDAETGHVIDVNPFFTETLGYPRQDLVNKPVWEFKFLQKVFSDRNKLVELKQKEFVIHQELPLITTRGDVLDMELIGSPLKPNIGS